MKNITLNGTKLPLPTGIPYASTIAGGLKTIERQQGAKAFKTESGPAKKRITRIENGKPVLVNGIRQQEAIERLFLYEESGETPYEVHILQERIKGLEKRVKQLESYD